MNNALFSAMVAGHVPADLRIDNVRIVDVFSGGIRPGCVCVGDGRVLGFSRREARQVFDGEGRFLLPGLIDAHVHIESSMLSPAGFASLVIPFGTTTIIADPHEIANVKGVQGIRYMLEAARALPLDIRIMLPSCVPCLPFEDSGSALSAADLAGLMDDAGADGLAEMMNVPGLLAEDPEVWAKLDLARAAGKRIDGHAPLLGGRDLEMYVAAGVSTDHECSERKEVMEKLECGMYVIIREGSAARNLAGLVSLVTPENERRFLFCTDDRHAADIMERGHISNNLRLAVSAGLDAVSAVRMATLNAAECCGLNDRGAIAPGRRADFALMDDLENFHCEACWIQGKLAAQHGRLASPLAEADASAMQASVNIAPLPEHPFAVRVPSGKARVIGMRPHSLITDCLIRPVRTADGGEVRLEDNPGLLKIAVLERHHATGKCAAALLDGWYGLRGGAIATTIAHDSHNLVVAGDNDADMLTAVREEQRIGGGIVMASGGRILSSLPLPIGGLMSDAPAGEVAQRLRELFALASSHYHIRGDVDAFMALSFLALPVIPSLKITARGLFDLPSFRFVSVDAEQD